jgi:hypothetical protein
MPKTSLCDRGRANKGRRNADELSQHLAEFRWARNQTLVGVALVFLSVLLLGGFYLTPDSTIGKVAQFLFAATFYSHGPGQLVSSERSIGLDLTLMVLSLSTVAVVSGAIDLFRARRKLSAFKEAHATNEQSQTTRE